MRLRQIISENKKIVGPAFIDHETGVTYQGGPVHIDIILGDEMIRDFGNGGTSDDDGYIEGIWAHMESGRLQKGFLDNTGKFYTRKEALAAIGVEPTGTTRPRSVPAYQDELDAHELDTVDTRIKEDEQQSPITSEQREMILSDRFTDRRLRVRKNARFWRAINTTSGNNGATYGTGLYITGNRAEAKEWVSDGGRVAEMSISDIPHDPLFFSTINDYQMWLQAAQRIMGMRVREFTAAYPDIRKFMHDLDPEIDGIQLSTGKDAWYVNYYAPHVSEDITESVDRLSSWFGNSVVVDKTGKPMVVYHGTNRDFNTFSGMVWASVDTELAHDYAAMRSEFGDDNNTASIIPMYMRLLNPFNADLLPKTVTVGEVFNGMLEQAGYGESDIPENIRTELLSRWEVINAGSRDEESGPHYSRHDFWNNAISLFGKNGADAILAAFKILGFDGVQMIEGGELTYGVFNPNQVKSIFNRGTYDQSPHIGEDLSERAGSPLSTSKTLYHGTTLDIAKKALQHGLWPSVGAFVEQMYGEPGLELEELVFAADKDGITKATNAMSHHVARQLGKQPYQLTSKELYQNGALLVIKSGGEEMTHHDDEAQGWGEQPHAVEPDDYYSDDSVDPDYILTGKKLRQFITRIGLQKPKQSGIMHTDQQRNLRIRQGYEPMPESVTDRELHQAALDATGYWGNAGAGCLIMAADTKRFLMPLRSEWVQEPLTWSTWGGAIDKGEDPKTAALREVSEEAGYNGRVLDMIHLYTFKDDGFTYDTFVAIVETEFEPQLNWETDQAEWVEFGQWPKPLHFGLTDLLNNTSVSNKLGMLAN